MARKSAATGQVPVVYNTILFSDRRPILHGRPRPTTIVIINSSHYPAAAHRVLRDIAEFAYLRVSCRSIIPATFYTSLSRLLAGSCHTRDTVENNIFNVLALPPPPKQPILMQVAQASSPRSASRIASRQSLTESFYYCS